MLKKKRTIRRLTSSRATALRMGRISATPNLDSLTQEFCKAGIFRSVDSEQYKALGLTDQVRQAVSRTIELVVNVASFSLLFRPKFKPLVGRFFDDLEAMVHLIKRNRNLGAYDVVSLTEPRLENCTEYVDPVVELSPNLGDGRDQAAAA